MYTIHPAIIEEERRRREDRNRMPAQIPLHIPVPDNRQIPPGWEPDPNSRGGYRRKEDSGRDSDGNERGVVIIQM